MPTPTFEREILRTLVEHIPHRIYAKDKAGRFVFANMSVAKGMGAAGPEDLLDAGDRVVNARSEADDLGSRNARLDADVGAGREDHRQGDGRLMTRARAHRHVDAELRDKPGARCAGGAIVRARLGTEEVPCGC